MEQYLVLDIGGTFIKYALMDREAQFIEQGKVLADTTCEEAMLASLGVLQAKFSEVDYQGVAISMPGRLDTATGWAYTGGSFKWLHDYPAAEKYGAVFGKPCTIANDGKCAAYAESWAGALSDVDSGVVLVLGTGIGGGIVLDKKVWMGCSGGAGELSWFINNLGGVLDGMPTMELIWCGKIAAGAIVPKFAQRKGLPQADGIMLFDAYEAGDPDAIAVLEEYAKWAAGGIMSLQATLDVQRYAIGGGISARPEATTLIADAVDKAFSMYEGLPFSKPEVVTCKFGNEANLIGALAFYLQQKG